MRIIGVINIQSSLFISSLSAIGLGVLLSVVQVKTPEHFQETEFLPSEEKNDSFKSSPGPDRKTRKRGSSISNPGLQKIESLKRIGKRSGTYGSQRFRFCRNWQHLDSISF